MESGRMSDSDWQSDKPLLACLNHLFTTGTASDVAFVVSGGKGQILAHKTILVSRSSVFCTMLDDPTISKWEITLLDTQQHIFSIFLRYLYTDMIELTVDVATSVLPLARQYCVNHLVRKCEMFLKENFASQNTVMFLQNSRLPDDEAQDDDMDDDNEDVTLESEDDKKPEELKSSDQNMDEDLKDKSGMTDVDTDKLPADADEDNDADEDGDTHVNVTEAGDDKHLVDADHEHLSDADSDKLLSDEETDTHLFDADFHPDTPVKNVSLSTEKPRVPVSEVPVTEVPDEGSAMDLTVEPSTSKILPENLYVAKEFSAPSHSADEEMVDVGSRRAETSSQEEPTFVITSLVRGLMPKCLEVSSGWQPLHCHICGRTFFNSTALSDHENKHKIKSEQVTAESSVSRTKDYNPNAIHVSGQVFSEANPPSDFGVSVRNTNQESMFVNTTSKALNLQLMPTDRVTCKQEPLTSSEDDTAVQNSWPDSAEFSSPDSSNGRSSQQNQHLRISLAEMPYHCPTCGRMFKLAAQLEKHSKKHLWDKLFICKVCGLKFGDQGSHNHHLQVHTKDASQPVSNTSCQVCLKKFRLESTYKEHLMKEHVGVNPFRCRLCEREFKSRLGLKLHMMGHTGERPHMCNVCGKGFRQKVSLLAHSKKHTEEGHPCNVCGHTFRTDMLLHSHLASHKQVQMFPCGRCGKEFRDERFYVKHMEAHGTNMTLACEHCELEFEEDELYKVHRVTDHEGLEFDEPGNLSCGHCTTTFKSEKAFSNHQMMHIQQNEDRQECDTCGLVFASQPALQQHSRIHDKDKMFQCEMCGKQYKSKCALLRHVMYHTGDWKHKCEVCGRGFSTSADLKKHMLAHSKERAHMCDVCGNRYKNQVTLDRHLMLHRGDLPHVCEICGKGYTDKYQLKMHLKAHAREKPHKCDVCRKGFDDADMLLSHSIEHMGKKLFKCDICGKFYSRDSALKVHLRIHTGEKPYKCEMCGKDFTNLGDKQRHVKIHTGEKPFICDVCGKGFSDKKYLKKHTLSNAHKPDPIYI